VISGLRLELQALRTTNPGMTLLSAVEFVTSDPARRVALYKLCSVEAREIRSTGMGQDDSQRLKFATLADQDLALLERRAKARGILG
jgi:hypothetical protein